LGGHANIEVVLPLAHAGHTITTIAYFLPVVAFLIWLTYTVVKDRLVKRTEDVEQR
jgi:hypothetical protein